MKILLLINSIIIFTMIVGSAQDTTNMRKLSEQFYAKQAQDYYTQSKEFSRNFYKKNGYPPTPDVSDAFFKSFHRKLRASVSNEIQIISKTKEKLLDSLIIFRLNLLNYKERGKNPDSMFLVLMNSYYELDKESAIDFCTKHLQFRRLHNDSYYGNKDIRDIYNHPYIIFLFEKLSVSQLLEVFVLLREEDFNNEALLKKVYYELIYYKSKGKKEPMKIFIENYIMINSIEEYNKTFVNFFNE